jgi:hypothetical protein
MKHPIYAQWDGESFVPMKRFAKACDQELVVGKVYCLDTVEDRSLASHRRYFAALNDAWANLREDLAEEYPSPEHFRKKLLVKAGYAKERVVVCSSKAQAHDIAAAFHDVDEYCVAIPFENVLKIYTAESQSMRAMGKKRFLESADKVLALAAEMIGAKPEDLGKAA